MSVRIEVIRTFDVSVAAAFACEQLAPVLARFIRIEETTAASWSTPGDTATVVIKLLNREYEPRRGFAGLFERMLVSASAERAVRKTVQDLERLFRIRSRRWPRC